MAKRLKVAKASTNEGQQAEASVVVPTEQQTVQVKTDKASETYRDLEIALASALDLANTAEFYESIHEASMDVLMSSVDFYPTLLNVLVKNNLADRLPWAGSEEPETREARKKEMNEHPNGYDWHWIKGSKDKKAKLVSFFVGMAGFTKRGKEAVDRLHVLSIYLSKDGGKPDMNLPFATHYDRLSEPQRKADNNYWTKQLNRIADLTRTTVGLIQQVAKMTMLIPNCTFGDKKNMVGMDIRFIKGDDGRYARTGQPVYVVDASPDEINISYLSVGTFCRMDVVKALNSTGGTGINILEKLKETTKAPTKPPGDVIASAKMDLAMGEKVITMMDLWMQDDYISKLLVDAMTDKKHISLRNAMLRLKYNHLDPLCETPKLKEAWDQLQKDDEAEAARVDAIVNPPKTNVA